MRSIGRLLANNGPGQKPELWSDLPTIARRRLVAWLSARLDASWTRRPYIATLKPDQLLLEVTPGDVVGKPIVQFGMYEYAVTSIVRRYLKPGDAFVDVGANIGYYSIIAGQMVGPAGRVLAFEPSPRIRARLERNIALNGFTHVSVRAEAVGRVDGEVRLIEPNGQDNDGLAFVDADAKGGLAVRSIRLDDLFPETEAPPSLLKVDVEGGEPDVFAGAQRLFARDDAPSIVFESFAIERDGEPLRAHGYAVLQPCLKSGQLYLTEDLTLPRYRAWEAPNYLAVKSARGRAFIERMLLPARA